MRCVCMFVRGVCVSSVSRLLSHTGNAKRRGRNLGAPANRGLPDRGERKLLKISSYMWIYTHRE